MRFEWATAHDRWFYEVVQIDTAVHHRRGRIVDGDDKVERSDTQRFTADPAASARYDQLCEEARYEGGEEVDLVARASQALRTTRRAAGQSPTEVRERDTSADHPELERECLASPDDPAPWLVLADHLEAHGDVRAKIAMFDRAGQSARVAGAIREALRGIADEDDVEEDLVGSSDREVSIECALRFGFVRHATIKITIDTGIGLDVVTRRFLAGPLGRFVDSMRFGLADFEGDNDWEPTLRAIALSPQASQIRALAFDAFDSEDNEWSWVEFGDFTGLLEKLPALESLRIRSGGGGTLGALALPRLRTFVRESGGLGKTELDAIENARWPALRHLEVWTGSSDYGAVASPTTFEGILAARGLPELRHLGIVNSELVDELVPVIAASTLLPQLESLDLSRGTLVSADGFVEHAAAFRHLAAIDLSQNVLSPDQADRIRGVLDNVILTKQRPGGDDDRYVVVGE